MKKRRMIKRTKRPKVEGGALVTRVHNSKKPLDMGKKIHRNDPCHCKSGKKYKACCQTKDELPFKITAEDKEKHGIKE